MAAEALPHVADLEEACGDPACFTATSAYGCCPLCSAGEWASEHLLNWCPAVAAAWFDVSGQTACSLRQALLLHADRRRLAVRTLHQVSFLALSLVGRCSVTAATCGRPYSFRCQCGVGNS